MDWFDSVSISERNMKTTGQNNISELRLFILSNLDLLERGGRIWQRTGFYLWMYTFGGHWWLPGLGQWFVSFTFLAIPQAFQIKHQISANESFWIDTSCKWFWIALLTKVKTSFFNKLSHIRYHLVTRKKTLSFSPPTYQTNGFKDRHFLFLNPAKLVTFHSC